MKLQLSEVHAASEQKDLEAIQSLMILGRELDNITVIAQCVNLVSLDLSNNNIVDLAPIQGLRFLKKLILEQNHISNLQVFQKIDENHESFFRIEELSLKDNDISYLQELHYLSNIITLKNINLLGNDCINDSNFLQYALAILPNVRFLNEETVREENGDLCDLDKFIDSLPGEVEDVEAEPWLPESSFDLIELPGFNDICIELEQAVKDSIEKYYIKETKVDE